MQQDGVERAHPPHTAHSEWALDLIARANLWANSHKNTGQIYISFDFTMANHHHSKSMSVRRKRRYTGVLRVRAVVQQGHPGE